MCAIAIGLQEEDNPVAPLITAGELHTPVPVWLKCNCPLLPNSMRERQLCFSR